MNTIDQIIEMGKISINAAKSYDSKELFILNTCDIDGKFAKGDLILKITTPESNIPKRITIPDTWVPWEITHYFSKDKWLTNFDFIKQVTKGAITIVDPDIAKKLIETEEGSEEYKRCINLMNEIESGYNSVSSNIDKIIEQSTEDRQKIKDTIKENSKKGAPQSINNVTIKEDKKTDQPNPKIVAIINSKSHDDIQKVNALRNMGKSLSKVDIGWIIANSDKSNVKLREYVISLR